MTVIYTETPERVVLRNGVRLTTVRTERLPYFSQTLLGTTVIFTSREARDAAERMKRRAGCYTNVYADRYGPALHYSYPVALPTRREYATNGSDRRYPGFPHELLAFVEDSGHDLFTLVRDAGGTACRRDDRLFYTLHGYTLVKEAS